MPTSKKPRKKAAAKKKSQMADVIRFAPKTPAFEGFMSGFGGRPVDQAQDVMYDAWECGDPKQRVALAREALDISPLCADAYVLLAKEAARSQEEALAYYKQAVEVGAEALGPAAFQEYAGHFWGFVETRPYMRARTGLGEALWVTGEKDAAIQNFREMLELNPGDNQGIRYVLAAKLLEIGRMDELKSLLEKCADEYSADIQYTRTLLAYFEDAENAEEIAELAWDTNQHVPGMLSGRIATVELHDYITMGGKDEASSYVGAFGGAWKRTPGAIEWLEEVTGLLESR